MCGTQDVRMECVPVLPDSLVLEIFLRLPHDAVLRAGLTCRQWLAVSRDEFLWRELFYSYYRIPRSVPRHPGKPVESYIWQRKSNSSNSKRRKPLTAALCVDAKSGFCFNECWSASAQRLCHGTESSDVCLTVSPAWRFRPWENTLTKSSTWLSLTGVTGSRPALKTALLRWDWETIEAAVITNLISLLSAGLIIDCAWYLVTNCRAFLWFYWLSCSASLHFRHIK